MEDKRDLSLRLSSVLENVGASVEFRRLHRDTGTIQEILSTVDLTILHGVRCNFYCCGSSYEGTVTPDLSSDIDVIHCLGFFPVVLDVKSSPPGISFTMARDSWTYPGYVKLQVVRDGHPLPANNRIRSEYQIDNAGRVCMKHIQLPNMKGPASMTLNESGEHIFDHVPAYKCDSIPTFVHEWFLRPRPYGRPSQEQLQAMSGLGCMVVGAGHVDSGEKDIEWRLSFSLQERQLVSGLNPVQHKVYVLLKMIKKNILAEIYNDETLTSYHCKTCVLFTVQMTPERAWTEENLINCLLQCLKLLIKWMEKGNCPHYFVKDQNLYLREGFRSLRMRLLRLVRRILETGTNFLYMIQSDNVGDILKNGDWRRYREITSYKKNDHIVKLKTACIKNTSQVALRLMKGMSRGCYDPVTLASALDALQKTETVTEHTVEDTQSSLAYLFPWFHLHIAKSLVCLTYRYPDRADHRQMLEKADFHFNQARGSDLVNERLARASVLYKSEQYDECFVLLQQTENEFIGHVLLYCPCTCKRECVGTYYDISDQHEQYGHIANLNMRQLIASLTACCVVFLPSQLEITPVPLQCEMQRSLGTQPGSRSEMFHFWFDWAVVDAKVYLFFMQYLVSSKLHKEAHKQVAMDNLRAEITEDDQHVMAGSTPALGHKETAYNLLGWIYMQTGRFAEAFVCIAESWKIRPFHNAAKLHMRDYLARLSGRHK